MITLISMISIRWSFCLDSGRERLLLLRFFGVPLRYHRHPHHWYHRQKEQQQYHPHHHHIPCKVPYPISIFINIRAETMKKLVAGSRRWNVECSSAVSQWSPSMDLPSAILTGPQKMFSSKRLVQSNYWTLPCPLNIPDCKCENYQNKARRSAKHIEYMWWTLVSTKDWMKVHQTMRTGQKLSLVGKKSRFLVTSRLLVPVKSKRSSLVVLWVWVP